MRLSSSTNEAVVTGSGCRKPSSFPQQHQHRKHPVPPRAGKAWTKPLHWSSLVFLSYDKYVLGERVMLCFSDKQTSVGRQLYLVLKKKYLTKTVCCFAGIFLNLAKVFPKEQQTSHMEHLLPWRNIIKQLINYSFHQWLLMSPQNA